MKEPMRIAWLTDVHFGFLKREQFEAFALEVGSASVGAVVITGDISEAQDVSRFLQEFQVLSGGIPLYFVLGNHDFYNGAIEPVRRQIQEITDKNRIMFYCGLGRSFRLTEHTVLAGCDGWSDGLAANFLLSGVMLNDYFLIKDLVLPTKMQLADKLKELGAQEAQKARQSLRHALEKEPGHIFFVTHPPPFREACWHEGGLSTYDWMPHFVCMQVGEVLMEMAMDNPKVKFTVLCGHTHSDGVFEPLENLTVKTGGAVYGETRIVEILEVE